MEPGKPFDFDSWSVLARTDPGGFETRRRAVLDAFIDSQTPQRRQRLRRLQWRIDRERERARSPLYACIRLSDLMWERFAGSGGLIESLNTAARPDAAMRTRPAARVIPFRRR